MQGLFYVEAPFQLISAFEAIKVYKLDYYHIYIRLSKHNDTQLKNVVTILFDDISNISYFYIENHNRSVKDYLVALKYYIYAIFQKVKYDYVFIGNYESKFLSVIIKVIDKSKIVLLDDGVKTFAIQKKFTDENSYNLFTMLKSIKPLRHQSIICHNFVNIKHSLIQKNQKKYDRNQSILFLGSKMVEVGIISKDEYLEHLVNVLKAHMEVFIIYIPHRGEDIDKLHILEDEYHNFKIKVVDLPIELYILDEFSLNDIKYVISFYSAALISLKLMYSDIKVYCLAFDFYGSKYSLTIEEVYKNMHLYGVKNFYMEHHV